MEVTSLGFRTDLALLRLGGSVVEDRGDRLVVRTPDNPRFHWGNFVLLSRPPTDDEVPGLLAAYDAAIPDGRHRSIGIDGTGDQQPDLGPLTARGLVPDSSTVMTASAVHEPPRPHREAVLRPLTGDDDWSQRTELSWACHADGATDDYREYAAAKSRSERGLVEAGHGQWWGAFLGGRLVSAMGLFLTEPGLARFQSVETHPDHRGRGLAGTLAHRVGCYGLEELQARTLVMVADPVYLAIRIYRSIGFVDGETQTQLHQSDRRTSPA